MSCDDLSLIVQFFADGLPSVSKSDVKAIEQQIRSELAGHQIYIKKNEESRREAVRQQFNGKNMKPLAKRFGVSVRTIRRWVSKG